MILRTTVKRSAYYDSVTLMRAQQALRALPGIAEAGVVMGTAANLDLLRQAGLDAPGLAATPGDLVVAVSGDSDEHVGAALAAFETVIAQRSAGSSEEERRPRTVGAAARLVPGANLALVSVPGRFAAGVADDALQAGLHVMLFSDNVPLADEIRLKQAGKERGRLVMGPDCGTALIGGAALGFANVVRRGPVGIVAAAGTGLQEVAAIVHRQGVGISHALGTGGRDMAAAVGGMTMSRGLAMLGRDPRTQVVVLISKPPDAGVADRVLAQAAAIGKPVVVAFPGGIPRPAGTVGPPSSHTGLCAAATLEEAALTAVRLSGKLPLDLADRERWRDDAARRARTVIGQFAPGQRFLRGLYSGGTLCAECVALLQGTLRPLHSNIPTGAAVPHTDAGPSRAHTVLDLGDDLFTVGRLHPMLDMTLRIQRLAQEAADPEVGVVLLDVVIGEGVHPDPAGALAPAIEAARAAAAGQGRSLAIVASVCGTDEDPQNRSHQIARLRAAGVLVEPSNARAAVLAGMIAGRSPDAPTFGGPAASGPPGVEAPASCGEPPAPRVDAAAPRENEDKLLAGSPRVVNAGLAIFADSLRAQGVAVIDVDWRPPAGGDPEMIDLLERLR
jgi:FdrA protein